MTRSDFGREVPLAELRDVRVQRDGRTILDVERLALRQGEHVAILGPNGAGKSTLLATLLRDVLPYPGDVEPEVRLLGKPRWDLFEARRILGAVSDDLQDLYDRGVSVEDAVVSGFFGSIGLYPHQDVTAEMRQRAEDVVRFLEIERLVGRRMDTLSTGEARRALIGRALVHDPLALVLDEPCDGLDPHVTWRFLALLRRIAQEGRTLILVTHRIEDIVPEVSRVIMMKDGLVFRDGPKAELLADEALSELFDIPARVEERDGRYRLWFA